MRSHLVLAIEAFRPRELSFVLDANGWHVEAAPDAAWIEAQLALTDSDVLERPRHLRLVPALSARASVKPSLRRRGWRKR